MSYNSRKIQFSDYPMLVEWWNAWNFTPPPHEFLPTSSEDEYSGYIIEVDGKPLCAGFFYLTNSPVGWVEWIVSVKEKSEHRSEALVYLIDLLTSTLTEAGCMFAYATLKHPGLISKYEALGYIQGDSNATEMIKAL